MYFPGGVKGFDKTSENAACYDSMGSAAATLTS